MVSSIIWICKSIKHQHKGEVWDEYFEIAVKVCDIKALNSLTGHVDTGAHIFPISRSHW